MFDPKKKMFDVTPQPLDGVVDTVTSVGEFRFHTFKTGERVYEAHNFVYDVSPQSLDGVVTNIYQPAPVPSGIGHTFIIPKLENETKEKVAEDAKYSSRGTHYGIQDNRLYAIGSKNKRTLVVPATLKILEIIRRYISDSEYEEYYTVEVISEHLPPSTTIVVRKSEFGKVYEIIQREHPEIPLFNAQGCNKNSIIEYTSEIVRRDISICKISHVPKYSGWFAPPGEMACYRLGDDEFYKDWYITSVTLEQRSSVIINGANFLELGNTPTVGTLWLFSHIAYTLYWFREAKQDFASILLLNGESGSLKTAVAKVLAFPFMMDRQKVKMRLASTSASVRDFLLLGKDSVVLLDDSSGSEASNQKKINTNSEIVIRSVSDGTIDAHMDMTTKRINHKSCRLALILTGEDKLQLGESSQLRLIECPVNRETFDGNVLRCFQQDSGILNYYFSVYIDYLTEIGPCLRNWIGNAFDDYRKEFSSKFSARRFVDSAAGLAVIADILVNFMHWGNVAENTVNVIGNRLKNDAMHIMLHNDEAEVEIRPTTIFIETLFTLLDSTREAAVAENEAEFETRISECIGFREDATDTVWVKQNETYELVSKTIKSSGGYFNTSFPKLKEMLFREGFTDGQIAADGHRKYVKRAKRGKRKYFLVFKMEKVKDVIFKEDD